MKRKRVLTKMRLLRESANISQTELAKLLGVSQGKVSAWEGLVTPMPRGRVAQTAHILGCVPHELLSNVLAVALEVV